MAMVQQLTCKQWPLDISEGPRVGALLLKSVAGMGSYEKEQFLAKE